MLYSGFLRANRSRVTLVAVLIVMVSGTGWAQYCPGGAFEGWDTGDDAGWSGGTGTTVTVAATGGNPGGYLSAENDGNIMIMSWTAPFAADYAAGGVTEIGIDVQLMSGVDVYGPHFRLRDDAVSNGWAYFNDDQLVVDAEWHHGRAVIDPTWSDQEAEAAGWTCMDTPTSVSFADTVASVGYLIIWVSASFDDEVAGYDNVRLECHLFRDDFESAGLEEWSSTTN